MTESPKRQWLEPAPIDVPAELASEVGGNRLVAEHLARKGIDTASAARRFMYAERYQPASANELPDIDRAVERLKRAIRAKEQILVWGDFDVDGQTATALLVSALRGRGARVAYHVPNRFREGHGIHLPTLKSKLEAGVDLLLTCDTGSSAHEAADYCAKRGIDLLITDHHALPQRLPLAAAHLNPRRLPAGHALSELPGVGVAYKLIEALDGEGECEKLLDLVALGIVADVMTQIDDTRYLLQRGLAVLRKNQRVGIAAILERAEIPPAQLNERQIGFDIAPRLNALGRLDDANPAVELLTTEDWAKARVMAHSLESYNNRRKFLSNQVYQSAIAQVEAKPWLLEYAVLALSHAEWHSGVIGIVASRLVEEFGLPTILITTADGMGRGSARSIAGVDITAALGQVSPLLKQFGGHSMAAGMSLDADTIFDFRKQLSRVVRALDIPAAPPLVIDGLLPFNAISLELCQDIERLAPFGNGNPPLTLLSRDLRLVSHRALGRGQQHLQLEIADEADHRQRVIYWRGAGKDLPSGRFDLAYSLRTDSWKGQRDLLIEWLDCRAHEGAPLEPHAKQPAYEIEDYRQSLDPRRALAGAREWHPSALVWAEVDRLDGAVNRLNLRACDTLIVWSAPPSAEAWAAALETVKPRRLILFGARNNCENLRPFLQRLAGLAKFSINQRGGLAGLDELAAATNQSERAAQVGLQVLRALGTLDFALMDSGAYRVMPAEAPPSERLPALQKRLDLLLRESRAYRKYWLSMPV